MPKKHQCVISSVRLTTNNQHSILVCSDLSLTLHSHLKITLTSFINCTSLPEKGRNPKFWRLLCYCASQISEAQNLSLGGIGGHQVTRVRWWGRKGVMCAPILTNSNFPTASDFMQHEIEKTCKKHRTFRCNMGRSVSMHVRKLTLKPLYMKIHMTATRWALTMRHLSISPVAVFSP